MYLKVFWDIEKYSLRNIYTQKRFLRFKSYAVPVIYYFLKKERKV